MPTQTKLKYQRFKGDGIEDVDAWLEHYEAIAKANEEADDVVKIWLMPGLFERQAL